MEPRDADPCDSAQAAKPYHAKRAHKKSRTGCRTCKSRKVKCDEARPSCRNCVLRKTHCVYNQPPIPSSSSSSSSSASPPGQDSTSPDSSTSGALAVVPRRSKSSLPPRPPKPVDPIVTVDRSMEYRHTGADTMDMKLLWWYSTYSYNSFASGWGHPQRTQNILQVEVPRHAFASSFLMDIILGLAACHMQSEGQKDISARRVIAYRARAFAGYRRAMEERRPESFPGLLAGALMLTAVSSQTFRDDGSEAGTGSGPIDLYILDWMVVWRGIGAVIDLVSPEALYNLGMSELFFRPAIDLQSATAYIPSYLLRLLSSLHEADPEYPYRETYFQVLRYLGVLYQELRTAGMGPVLYLKIACWFTFLPTQFVSVARSRQPLALVIMAHYLIFVKLIDVAWWLRGIADREIRGVKRFLTSTNAGAGDEARWRNAMVVPDAALGLSEISDVAGLLVAKPGWALPCAPMHPAEMEQMGWVDNDGKPLVTADALKAACSNYSPDIDPLWDAEVERLLQNYEISELEGE